MDRIVPRYRWRLPDIPRVSSESAAAAERRGIAPRLLTVLAARGHSRPADLDAFLEIGEVGLHDPALLPDADRFAERIGRARAAGERVMVFGDFDADGLTGLAIMTLALRRLGLDVVPYVPSRVDEGHGLSTAAIDAARAQVCTLIVTVDCGSGSADEVEVCREAGIDVLITDHHRLPDRAPRAAALVNPHRADSSYPDDRLAGSGVAFKLAELLLRNEADGLAFARSLCDLAVIGTVADVAPLIGENRLIARLGLMGLRDRPRPGLAALLEVAGIQADRVDLETVAYALAPRLNAGGRVGDPMVAARLLLADDPDEAAALAQELDAANVTRREWTQQVLEEARLAAEATGAQGFTVVAGAWPVGIVGLVAGRLAEELGRPALVFSTISDPWRGSARAGAGADLVAAFTACGDLLERFGGHRQAAGCTLPGARLGKLIERLEGLYPGTTRDVPYQRELVLDLALPAAAVDYVLLRELLALEPTGPGNPVPLVGIEGLTVSRVRPATGGHAQITLRKGREVLDGIGFRRPDLCEQLREGDALDIVARVTSRSFGGFESLQLEVRDAAPAGTLLALRATQAAQTTDGVDLEAVA